MTRWVRWADEWHAVDEIEGDLTWILCSWRGKPTNPTSHPREFSDFEPVEDECRLCRRALDGGKQ